ncbi:hypothetical protein [Psychrobacter sp. UBA5136]|uniref:hypothetical protein n=1 Tax=Psychrobacter sp. UBA5136 TaxID=1947356 RepID=UPI0025D0427E|nr:hypothetical protein [Psychrobacter sp. UBA5136]
MTDNTMPFNETSFNSIINKVQKPNMIFAARFEGIYLAFGLAVGAYCNVFYNEMVCNWSSIYSHKFNNSAL